jgi:predicted membrane protein DUF2207
VGRGARRLGPLLGAVALLVLLGPLTLLGAGPAGAAGEEHISAYDVTLDVRADGSLGVREQITYDFGAQERHGIFRTIPVRVPYDDNDDRVYDLNDVAVTSSTRAPTQVDRSDSDGIATLRIGDPDRTVTGVQHYVVTYTVDGAINGFADHDELFWNAIGDGWPVPVDRATVTVTTPAPITRVACFAGPKGSTLPCGSIDTSGSTAVARQPAGLAPYDALTVVVGLPRGAVRATGPHLEERYTLRRALTPTPLTGSVAGLVLVPGLAGVALLVGLLGRDRRYAGLTPGLAPTTGSTEERVPLTGAGPVAVQFQPPAGLLPGQLGTLLDEQANVVDVTATIVDLAVRGHLRIVELPHGHWFSSRDWQLEKLTGGSGTLTGYESLLYDGLFHDGDQVRLSSLKKTFAGRMASVQQALYMDVVEAGWFRGRPDKVRGGYRVLGLFLAVGGGWLTFVLGKHLHWAPVGIAVSVVGVVLVALSGRMAARTARGSAVLAQAKGFRTYLATAEADQLRFEEGQDIFSRYLPFAVVFGVTDHWVQVFAPLAAAGRVAPAAWYVGPSGWDPTHFGDSFDGFASSAASTLAAATPSSSGGSGFGGGGSSGGGGGGGGGGSW